MNKVEIYISSFPKSGSTYFTHLLGDILNSPTGGCTLEEDKTDPAAEGQDRPGPYIIRRGHFILVGNEGGPIVPEPHKLAWKQLTNKKVVFLIRDPRDICISGAYHWQMSVEEFLDRMVAGDVAGCGRWDEYCKMWLDWGRMAIVSYQDISPRNIKRLLDCLKLDYKPGRVPGAFKRQSFAVRSIGLDEVELRRNNMRKGIVGDWQNYFTLKMNDKIWREFGWMMERLGYER